MNKNFEEFRSILIDLCDKALKGDLGLEAFFATWPEEITKTGFVLQLFDDLEDGVEHFPGHWLSGKKDFKTWESSDMAYRVSVDLQLLASSLNEEQMFNLRKLILDKSIEDVEQIKKLIEQQMSA